MATDILRIFDEEFINVAGIKATDSSNNTKTYIRPQGSETKTSNGTYDVTNLESLIVDVSSKLEPIATQSFGTMSVTNTSASDSGKTITVSGLEDYDVLIVEVSVDTKVNNRHAATVGLIWVTASTNLNTKDGTSILPAKNNFRMSSTGTPYSKYNTTSYGIYPYSCSAISNNSMTISFYQRYSSTGTGTINGAYTCRVYGISLYDLIGG